MLWVHIGIASMYTYNICIFNKFFTIHLFKQILNHFRLFKEMSM